MSGKELERAQRKLADEVNDLIKELALTGQVDAIKDMDFLKLAWRDPSRFKDPITGKLSCWGDIITDNSVAVWNRATNQKYDQWMLMPSNYNPSGIWVSASKIRVLMHDADGSNMSLVKDDGSFHSLQDAMKNAGKLAGAAMVPGATMDLSLGDDDLDDQVFCVWQAAFVEIPEDDNVELETYQEVLSYGSGSGAEVAAILMTGQGTSIKILEGGYGNRTKVRPSLDVNGTRHEFNLSITAMLDENGKSVEIKRSGTESKASAERAAAMGLAVEVPIGFGPKKMSLSMVALTPIRKLGAPPPQVIETVLYVIEDPMSLDKVFCFKRTDNRYVWAPTETVRMRLTSAVPLSRFQLSVSRLINYTPSTTPVAHPEVYVTIDPVNDQCVYSRRWTNGRYVRVSPSADELATLTFHRVGAPNHRHIDGYIAAEPTAEQLRARPELQNPFCRGLGGRPRGGLGGDKPPGYRSLGAPPPASAAAAGAAPPVAIGAEGEEAAAAVAQVTVDVPDTTPDTTSDETIAAVVQAEEDAKAPELGKRTLLQAELRKPPSNMFLTRQSRSKNSAGVAPMIRENIKRGLKGKTMLSVTIYYGIKPGSKPTKADILAVNQHIKEHMDAARALGGKDKTLDSTYSEVQGMTSTAPMSVQSKLNIAATNAAITEAPIVGVPLGLFS